MLEGLEKTTSRPDADEPSLSAENLEGHIGEQTGKEYAAGARHRSLHSWSFGVL
jgi:hypothetical protein